MEALISRTRRKLIVIEKKKFILFFGYAILLSLIPLSTLFQNLVGPINKIVVLLIFIFDFFIFWNNQINKKQFFLLFISIVGFLLSMINGGTLSFINSNMPIYFIMWIINVVIFSSFHRYIIGCFSKKKTPFLAISLAWNIVVFVSFFLPSSYSSRSGVDAFCSIAGDTFRLSTSIFGIVGLNYLISRLFGKKYILLNIVPAFSLFMVGSRTYFFIGIVLILLNLRLLFNDIKTFVLFLIPFAAFFAFFLINSTIFERFTNSLGNGILGFWGTFTSGRSDFWIIDLQYFFNSNLYYQMFGLGFNASNMINANLINLQIWSHNDFIECLLCGGYLQFFIYIYSLYLLFSTFVSRSNRLLLIILFFLLIFDSFFNMFYTYLSTTIGIFFAFLVASTSKYGVSYIARFEK